MTKHIDPRLHAMRENLELIRDFIADKSWYDFGCGYGLSSEVMLELGAESVSGFEPDESRAASCDPTLNVSAKDDAKEFDNVLAYGVFEHIYPELRRQTMLSLWGRLRSGGHLVIADTPNRLLPYDPHTTHLPLIPWLPERLARYIAEHSPKRWDWGDWRQCGWRGLWAGDFSHLPGRIDQSPITHRRHRRLSQVGLHPHLIDPWPVWVWRKT